MSQIFDYFACPRALIDKWADAMEKEDDDLQQAIESEMPQFVSYKNLGQDEFNLLAYTAETNDVDVVEAVSQIDLIKSVSLEEGPWVMAFHQSVIEKIAGLSLDTSHITRWVKLSSKFNGRPESLCRQILTLNAANTIKQLCTFAVGNQFGVFTCFYG